jgi:Ohr subfamily peroxiredoxin
MSNNISKFDGDALYTAHAKVSGGRNGHVKSDDGRIDMDLRLPKSMGGTGEGSNPEQLFAAGYAACFEGAVRYVAGQKKIKADDASVASSISIGKRQENGFAIRAKLEVSLPGVDDATAKEIVAFAHENVCPYSHATRGNIDVEISVNGQPVV